MASHFQTCELGDVAALYDSLHQTPKYTEDGYPMIRVTDIRRGSVDTTNAVRVDEETYSQFSKKHKPRIGDILFSRVGSYGNSSYVSRNEEFCLGQNTVCISPEKSQIEPTFLYFALNSDDLRHQIESLVGGASQGTISLKNIRKLQIPLPALPIQQRIAGILSAYDELIENSQRRIKILETMARSLYREWFVHFRFPGHENHPRVSSPQGEIPQGWQVKKLGEITEDIRRNVPKGNLQEPQPFVGLEHIPRRSLALDAWDTVTELGSNKLAFKKGEVLFGKIRPYFHKVSVAPFNGLCSADTIVIRALRQEYYASVVACVSSDAFVAEASATANGAKMPRANWDVLKNFPVVLPTGEIADKFSALITDVVAQQQSLIFQIQNLRRTRDLLLPRLLSGQIDVETIRP